MNEIKIVATIGPATLNVESLKLLHTAGMSVVRLNGSHGDLEWHRSAVKLIRETIPLTPILLDIPGRKIRTILLSNEPSFKAGDLLILTTDTSHDGSEKVPVNYPNLHKDVQVGGTIFADDGTLRFDIERIDGCDIHCRALIAGTLKSRKGINVPSVKLNTELVTVRDKSMIEFAKNLNVDFIGISFVESAQHVRLIRDLIGAPLPRVLAKVENAGGLESLEEIVGEADAIMIDRGDLSVETNLECLAINQKRIIRQARSSGKPVVVATEMLHSMIENNFPTKAEVVDIANAVLDGCSATMLSGETAVGKFPVESVRLMRNVVDATFASMVAEPGALSGRVVETRQAMIDGIVQMLSASSISKVVAITRTGYAARMLSARSVLQPILAISDDEGLARSFNLYSGVEGFHFSEKFPRNSADHVIDCLQFLYARSHLTQSDIVLVTGVVYPQPGVRMNLLQIHNVSHLIDQFGWKKDSQKV